MRYLILLSLCLFSCGSSQQSTSAKSKRSEPVLIDLYSVDREEQLSLIEAKQREEQQYKESLLHIELQQAYEFNTYQLCSLQAKNKKSLTNCEKILRTFCNVDMLIDSRSGHHIKRYCLPDFKTIK